MAQLQNQTSPSWGTNTKLVVALTIVVIVGALLVKFQFVLTPLLIALVMSYLFHPVASFMQRKLHFSWNAAISVVYFFVFILLVGLLTLGGVGLIQQIQSLVTIVQEAVANLPQLIESFSGKVYAFGPFKFDFSALDLRSLSSQILGMIQPLLSRTGALVSTVAGGAANFLGWTLFVILVSYFVLAESGGLRDRMITVDIPGYKQDLNASRASLDGFGMPSCAGRSSSSLLRSSCTRSCSDCLGCITPLVSPLWLGLLVLFLTLVPLSTGY